MKADAAPYTPESIRELLGRRELASSQQRSMVTKQLGMDATQAHALTHLARFGPLRPAQLIRLLGLSSGGVTALLQRLERAGRVSRRPHPHDKRSSVIEAAPEAIEQVQAHYTDLITDLDRIATRLSPSEREVVGRYLDQLVEVAERHAERAQAAASGRDYEERRNPVVLWP